MTLRLANTEGRPDVPVPGLGLANAFTVRQKDSLTIPYGVSLNGKRKQVFRREGAQEMVAALENEKGNDPDFGIPIFIGHPDMPELANEYPDKAAYAWIYSMEAGPTGLVLHPKWSAEGEALLANAKYRFPSPYWSCRVDAANSNTVYPFQLISIGLTNRPNIRAIGALVNEETPRTVAASASGSGAEITQQGETQMKELLLKLLGLANEATDEQIQEAAKDVDVPALKLALANEKTASATAQAAHETALANEKAAGVAGKTALETALANEKAVVKAERAARIELLVNAAITDGRVTLAAKPQWLADLDADFAGKSVALANAKPATSSESKTKDLGQRKPEVMDRQDKVLALVNARMKETGEDYIVAFTNVRKSNAALFAEMEKTTKA